MRITNDYENLAATVQLTTAGSSRATGSWMRTTAWTPVRFFFLFLFSSFVLALSLAARGAGSWMRTWAWTPVRTCATVHEWSSSRSVGIRMSTQGRFEFACTLTHTHTHTHTHSGLFQARTRDCSGRTTGNHICSQ